MTGNGRARGDTEALREEIRRTRVELSETMEALAAKADVKKRLRSSTEQAKERMREQATVAAARVRGRARPRGERVGGSPVPIAVLAAGAVAAVVVLMIVRGRRR